MSIATSNKLVPALVAVLAVAVLAGCTGLPAGSADRGDTVTVRYTAHDAETGAVLGQPTTLTFDIGSGASGFGTTFEIAARGHFTGDNFTVELRDDPALSYSGTAEVDASLPAIPMQQTAPRADFDQTPFGPATLGKTFAAYGIYTGTVTAANETEVAFNVTAMAGQEDPVPVVGAVLVTTSNGTHLLRTLRPVPGATFVIQPPSPFNPSTPLGLAAGSYRVIGLQGEKLLYEHSASTASALIGKDVRFMVSLLRIVAGSHGVEPVDGNYGVRSSPQVNGDPASALGAEPFVGEELDDHQHEH